MMLRKILVNAVLFAGVAGGLGYGSAHYAIENGLPRFVTKAHGAWKQWTLLGRPDADPYARAHMVRKGLLPVAATAETSFFADSDSSGGWLNAACEYRIVVGGFKGAWWSIAAYTKKGLLVGNAAERFAFTADTAMLEADGRAVVTLARDARPGNWLPIGSGGQLTVMLTVQSTGDDKDLPALPDVQRLGCR